MSLQSQRMCLKCRGGLWVVMPGAVWDWEAWLRPAPVGSSVRLGVLPCDGHLPGGVAGQGSTARLQEGCVWLWSHQCCLWYYLGFLSSVCGSGHGPVGARRRRSCSARSSSLGGCFLTVICAGSSNSFQRRPRGPVASGVGIILHNGSAVAECTSSGSCCHLLILHRGQCSAPADDAAERFPH